ncbi:MAG: hypothetical protein EXQ52_02620 [Bryobacterales bacterium]|nr:hypothetical protein [Bryobacterales bacterium]
MRAAFYLLFGAAFTIAVCSGLGRALLRGLSIRLHREEHALIGFVLGAPLLSSIVFLLTAAGFARKSVFLWTGVVILIAASRVKRGPPITRPALPNPLNPRWKKLFVAVFGVYFVLYFFNAMAPEHSPDGATYHLGLIARYLREHRLVPITDNMYAAISQGVDMLYLFAFSLGKHSAASMVHFSFLVTLPLLMICHARRVGIPAAGVCGALFFYIAPVTGIAGTSAYNDVAVAAVAFTLFYLLQIWDSERASALLVPIGLLAGFGYAAKYTAFLCVPFALGFIVWKTRPRTFASIVKPAAVVSACALLVMTPWLVRNALWFQNPFTPFLNNLFPNPYFHISFEKEYGEFMRSHSLNSWREFPLEATLGARLGGVIGPLFLLAPLALLALRWKDGRRFLAAAAVFAIPYALNTDVRFLLPALPFLSLAMAMTLTASGAAAAVLVLAHALASWPAVQAVLGHPHCWRLHNIPWRAALRIQSEDAYLTYAMEEYGIARMIERSVPPGERVFAFTTPAEAYTAREILVDYRSAPNELLRDILWSAIFPNRAPAWRLRFAFPAASLKGLRAVQAASGTSDQWSLSEFRIFHAGRELPRAAAWRLRAEPFPWDVQLAFDNSPVTRWRSWQTAGPGMFVEVDFAGMETVDSVVLECAHDQYNLKLRLEGRDGTGVWRTLSSAPAMTDAVITGSLRRAAARELKARGVGYILVNDENLGAGDFKNAAAWDMLAIGEYGPTRLYKIR